MFSQLFRSLIVCVCFLSLIFTNSNLTASAKDERLFLNLNLEFLGESELTDTTYQDTTVGGFSGITYDRQLNQYYVVSDDRAFFSPARFYTLDIDIDNEEIQQIKLKDVNFFKNEEGETYSVGSIDTEAVSLSPKKTLYVSSEGFANKDVPPFIQEFDLEGNLLNIIRIPDRYIPNREEKTGIENNQGFESLTIKANGFMPQDPFRLFTVTESALRQDIDLENPQTFNRSRLLHYVINPIGQPILVAEHLYMMDDPIFGTLYHGISDLLALPQEGNLLSVERTFGLTGFGVKIYQIVMANATDTSTFKSLAGNIDNVAPIRKKLLFDLGTLEDVELDNLEGMTFGPRFADGSRSLILLSDNNFSKAGEQRNQFLLFKLSGLKQ